jgi:hypothetical protein
MRRRLLAVLLACALDAQSAGAQDSKPAETAGRGANDEAALAMKLQNPIASLSTCRCRTTGTSASAAPARRAIWSTSSP